MTAQIHLGCVSNRRRLGWCLVWLWLASAGLNADGMAQEAARRTLKIKLIDDAQQPITDGLVAAAIVPPDSQELEAPSESSIDHAKRLQYITAQTDSDGEAILELPNSTVDIGTHVIAWKAGWVPLGARVAKAATLQLSRPVIKPVRVLGADDQPIAGLKVSVRMLVPAIASRADWQRHFQAVTDQQGIVRLPVDQQDNLMFDIKDSLGRLYGLTLLRRLAGSILAAEARDLVTVRLKAVGQIEGSLPQELATEYQPHLHAPRTFQEIVQGSISLNPKSSVASDGQFQIRDVLTDNYFLYLLRRQPYRADETLPEQLPLPTRVDVRAGQTSTVEFTRVPATVVAGRVIADDSPADLSSVQVSAMLLQLAGENTSSTSMTTVAQCNASGEYRLPLLPGKYRITLNSTRESGQSERWHSSASTEIEIGPGAATVTAGPLRAQRLRVVPVRMNDLSAERIVAAHDSSLSIRFQGALQFQRTCTLSTDGYGAVALPTDFRPASIQLVQLGYSATTTLLTDRDPSENFELEVDRQTRGKNGNISIRGRVIDNNGQPIPGQNCQLTIHLEAEHTDVQRSTISQRITLDNLVSGAQGILDPLPTQLFSAATIPANLAEAKLKITFALSVPPHAQQSVVTLHGAVNPWDQQQILLPDLVLPESPPERNVSGRLVDERGQPLSDQIVWLVQSPRRWRTLTDREGRFDCGPVSGSLWVLCEQGWTVRRIDALSDPVELVIDSSNSGSSPSAPIPSAVQPWQRATAEERRQLAKVVLDRMQKLPAGFMTVTNLPEAAYLEPDKYFHELLLKVPTSDALRLQYVGFWNLSDHQLQQLADACVSPQARAVLLSILARRHPSREAYEAVMECFYSDSPRPNAPLMLALPGRPRSSLANVAVELYRFNALEPHRALLEQHLATYQAQMDKAAENRERTISTEELTLRALLDPQAFVEQTETILSIPDSVLSAEQQSARLNHTMLLLRLAPHNVDNIPTPRILLNEEFLLEMGRLAPMESAQTFQVAIGQSEVLRWLLLGAMQAQHPQAAELLDKLHPQWLESTIRSELMLHTSTKSWEMRWVAAAKMISTQLQRQAAWQLAHKALFAVPRETTTLSISQRNQAIWLDCAYALADVYPEITQEILDQRLPQFLQQAELHSAQPFSRRVDLSVAAYFAPQQVIGLLERLSQRLNEEMKNAAQQQPYNSKAQALREMHISCLRGLLLDELISWDE